MRRCATCGRHGTTSSRVTQVFIIIIIYDEYADIYNHIPETNHVSTAYSVVAIAQLHFMIQEMLFPMLKRVVHLRQNFSKYEYSAQYVCFLYFLDFVFSR